MGRGDSRDRRGGDVRDRRRSPSRRRQRSRSRDNDRRGSRKDDDRRGGDRRGDDRDDRRGSDRRSPRGDDRDRRGSDRRSPRGDDRRGSDRRSPEAENKDGRKKRGGWASDEGSAGAPPGGGEASKGDVPDWLADLVGEDGAPKPAPVPEPVVGFGGTVKTEEGEWLCTKCKWRNFKPKRPDPTCVQCHTPMPDHIKATQPWLPTGPRPPPKVLPPKAGLPPGLAMAALVAGARNGGIAPGLQPGLQEGLQPFLTPGLVTPGQDQGLQLPGLGLQLPPPGGKAPLMVPALGAMAPTLNGDAAPAPTGASFAKSMSKSGLGMPPPSLAPMAGEMQVGQQFTVPKLGGMTGGATPPALAPGLVGMLTPGLVQSPAAPVVDQANTQSVMEAQQSEIQALSAALGLSLGK